MKDTSLPFLRDAATGVANEEIKLITPDFIPEGYASFGGELAGVGQQVCDDLLQAVRLRFDITSIRAQHIAQFHSGLHSHTHGFLHAPDEFVQVGRPVDELQSSGLHLRQIEDVAHKLQQQLVIVFDDTDELLSLRLVVSGGKQVAEPDDSIERRADFVAHVGQESRFQAVRFLRSLFGGDKLGLLLLACGDEKQRPDEFFRLLTGIVLQYRSVDLHPVDGFFASVVRQDSELPSHIALAAVQQTLIKLSDPVTVVGMDTLEILALIYDMGEHGRLRAFRDVDVADSIVGLTGYDMPLHVPFPGYDVGHIQSHLQCLGSLFQ